MEKKTIGEAIESVLLKITTYKISGTASELRDIAKKILTDKHIHLCYSTPPCFAGQTHIPDCDVNELISSMFLVDKFFVIEDFGNIDNTWIFYNIINPHEYPDGAYGCGNFTEMSTVEFLSKVSTLIPNRK